MARHTLNATTRDASVTPDDVRAEARIPAVIYGGARKEATSLSVDHSEFLKLYRMVTPSTLLDISVDGEVVQALIGEMQFHPVTDEILHVDLRQVDLNEPVKAVIELAFEGESPAVKRGGLLVTNRDFIRVKALPEKLVENIVVNLNELDAYDETVHVRDLALPEGVELLDDETASVAVIKAPKTQAQLEAELAEPEETEVTGAETEGEEGEEKPEGEAKESADESAE